MELVDIAKDVVKRKLVDLGRWSTVRLRTAMDMTILTLEAFNLLPQSLIALEVFGMCGLWVTTEYAPRCDYVELWELNPKYATFARKFVPKANVIIGDSIKAVNEGNLLRNDYNFIVIDNPISGPFNSGNYCEHFDLFPALLHRVSKKTVFVMNAIINMEEIAVRYPTLSFDEWTLRRKDFYGIQNDAEVRKINVDNLMKIYRKKFENWGVNIENLFYIPRNSYLGFIVIVMYR